jgi:hypothetical protein
METSSPGTGGFLEPADEDEDFFREDRDLFIEAAYFLAATAEGGEFFMRTVAFLEPTEEDGDVFTGVLVSLAAKAGSVFFFIGTAAFLEPAEENRDFLAGVLTTSA